MSKTISVSLSEKSFLDASKEILKYKKEIIAKCRTFAERLAERGVEIAKMKIQMQQYQEQAKSKQAYAILGQVFQIIQEKYPEDDILPSETNKIEIYEELNEHLLQTVTNIMDTRMNEIYDEMAETVKNILIKERTEPFMKYEDRIKEFENEQGDLIFECFQDEIS